MGPPQLIRVEDKAGLGSAVAVPCALVIGNFDGVHRGHRAVLERAVAEARARSAGKEVALAPCVLTFDPHPAEVVGAGALPLLTSLETRVELITALGVERVYARRFDPEFAAWPPERFAGELVADTLLAKVVVVGGNFRFGARREGDLELLRAVGKTKGFEVVVPDVAGDRRGSYSSTRAREAIIEGDLREATQVLGRPHAVSGTVVAGSARGRTIGFPTANLGGVSELLPSDGVYAVTVDRRSEPGDAYRPLAWGITNIGVRPTLGSSVRTVETYILDVSLSLYGAQLRLHFIDRLREEKKFASLEELRAQISKDEQQARGILSQGAAAAVPPRQAT